MYIVPIRQCHPDEAERWVVSIEDQNEEDDIGDTSVGVFRTRQEAEEFMALYASV